MLNTDKNLTVDGQYNCLNNSIKNIYVFALFMV